ncbi:hypothetical protein [Aeropyrum camini]|uniref:Uncharacterized protein n=1 Tax=Aeropyrum camini SY1 = JCM 12091 TaxID=1198449 RepID=U3TCF6_9CREN|nr:hypothetical protein [Aeropyrum camini]BAN89618.1 hypothetical protein ACAM_0149 [Aeropyrum camini SY1 = JCM 12091]
MSEEGVFKVSVGDKEIVIDEKILEILRRYRTTEMSLDQLAAALSLESWEEAYEFVKNIPAWILSIEPSQWKTMSRMKGVREEMAVEK